MNGKEERDLWGSGVGEYFLFTPGAIFVGWVGGVPYVLVSGIAELAIDLIYSKEIPACHQGWERT